MLPLTVFVLGLHPLPSIKMCTVSCALRTPSKILADNIKVEQVYARLARAIPELVQLHRTSRDVPRPDDVFLRGSHEKHAGAVNRERRDGRLVCADDLQDGERLGRKQQDVARNTKTR